MNKFYGLLTAAVFGGALAVSSAHAMPVSGPFSSDATCTLTQLTPNADACWGSANPEVNDSESLLNDEVFLDDGNDTLTVLGLFNTTDWQYAQKDEGTLDTAIDVGLDSHGTNFGTDSSGNWSLDASKISVYEQVLVILKAGKTFAAYLFDTPLNSTGGTWDTSALQDKGLSHLSVYVRGTASTIPLPAGILLLLTGIGGLAFVGRRRKALA